MSYSRAINTFINFRDKWNLGSHWPVNSDTIVAFFAFLSIEGWASASIFLHLSAIAFVHKINGWPDPTNSFIVKKMKEGSKRLKSCADSRRPITFPILSRLIQVLPAICKSTYEVSLFKAAFLLAFFGFLRVSEFACASKKSDVSRVISIGDVSFEKDHSSFMVVTIRFSKTDQCGVSVPLVIYRISDISICPVQALLEFLSLRVQKEGPIFMHFGGDPLTCFQVGHVLKKGISAIGLQSNAFSPHSFRIGAATSAALCGISDDEIKKMGRWKSSAFQFYIRPDRLLSFI